MKKLGLLGIGIIFSAGSVNAAPIAFNGHFYDVIVGDITWEAAKSEAETLSHNGFSGYLATVTSAAENDFIGTITGNTFGDGWIGASDAASEGVWQWVTGPEAGTTFFENNAAVSGQYVNWNFGEPNDGFGAGENYSQLTYNGWNDLGSFDTVGGYIVEFSSPSAVPVPAAVWLFGSGLLGMSALRRKKSSV